MSRRVLTSLNAVIGLRPTGWTFKSEGPEDKLPSIAKTLARDSKRGFSPAYLYPQRDSTERCQAYGVPYSEHSVRASRPGPRLTS